MFSYSRPVVELDIVVIFDLAFNISQKRRIVAKVVEKVFAVAPMWTNTCVNFLCAPIDLIKYRYLVVLLRNIFLVNTDGVDPDILIFPQSTDLLQNILAITADFEMHLAENDVRRMRWVSPSIGNGVVARSLVKFPGGELTSNRGLVAIIVRDLEEPNMCARIQKALMLEFVSLLEIHLGSTMRRVINRSRDVVQTV